MKHECKKPPFVPPCPPPDTPNFCPPPQPPIPPMPPAPSVVEGMSLYEAVNDLSNRVNLCINTYNDVMAENYKTLRNLERAAEENGAYYGPCEVWTEEGYLADESAAYTLIHKAFVDRRGQPIRMELGLAYGNTTNSKIDQGLFSASKVNFADKIMVALPKTDKGWFGNAIWHGAPIASAEEPTLYTVGFTRSGHMRVYSNAVSVDQMLRDTVENAMGCYGVLIQNGQLTEESWRASIPDVDKQVARVVMGQNMTTKEVLFLVCGNENDVNRKGMTSAAAAKILLEYGCDVAVELCEGASAGAMDKGSLMFVPDNNEVPTAYAFWYISRKKFYKTDYERELAELMQNYGECIWQGFLNGKDIESLQADLAQEIQARIDADKALQENINAEEDARVAADKVLQENIDKEQARAEGEEQRIEKKLDTETDRATGEEQRIEGRLNEEITRATTEEKRIDAKLDTEIARAKAEETKIAANLDAEIKRSTQEDENLSDRIDAEAHSRQEEDTRLHQEILTETGNREAADTTLQGNINTEQTRATAEEQRIEGRLETEISRATGAENKLTADLATEKKRATDAENALTANLNTERTRATNAEQAISADLAEEVKDRKDADLVIQGAVDSEAATRAAEDAKLQESITNLTTRVTTLESGVSNLRTITDNLTTQMASLDSTVQAGSQAISAMEVTLNSMKQQLMDMQTQITEVKAAYLPLTGGTMTGTIAWGTGAVAPTTDGVSIQAVDGAYLRVKKDGTVMVGKNDSSAAQIKNVAEPSEDSDVATKKYTDGFLPLSGGRVTGTIRMMNEQNPVVEAGQIYGDYNPTLTGAQMVLKGYRESRIIMGDGMDFRSESGKYNFYDSDGKTPGLLKHVATPVDDTDAANKAYVDSKADGGDYLPLTGGKMTGSVKFASDILPNKTPGYIAGVGDTFTQENNLVIAGPGTAQILVEHSNITLSSELDVDNNRIKSVAVPTENNDAANKKYVDDADAKKLDKTGGTLSGAIAVQPSGMSKVTISSTAHEGVVQTTDGEVASKYINETVDPTNAKITYSYGASKLPVTLSGVNTPSADGDAANKKYVDAQQIGTYNAQQITITLTQANVWEPLDTNLPAQITLERIVSAFFVFDEFNASIICGSPTLANVDIGSSTVVRVRSWCMMTTSAENTIKGHFVVKFR